MRRNGTQPCSSRERRDGIGRDLVPSFEETTGQDGTGRGEVTGRNGTKTHLIRWNGKKFSLNSVSIPHPIPRENNGMGRNPAPRFRENTARRDGTIIRFRSVSVSWFHDQLWYVRPSCDRSVEGRRSPQSVVSLRPKRVSTVNTTDSTLVLW